MAIKKKTKEEKDERRIRRQEKKKAKYNEFKQGKRKFKKIKVPKTTKDQIKEINTQMDKKRNSHVVKTFLEKRKNKKEWRTLRKPDGEVHVLTKKELSLIEKFTKGSCVDQNIDMFPEYIDFYTSDKIETEMGPSFEKKGRFVPSKSEKKMIIKIIKKIKNKKEVPAIQEEKDIDIWETPCSFTVKPQFIQAPRMTLPGTEESYNPPKDILLKKKEKGEDVLKTYGCLRKISAYENYFEEQYERSLDLFLCPREVAQKLDISPESLLPPKEDINKYRPFPDSLKEKINGHKGKINGMSIDQTGQWLITCGEDMALRVWEIESGLLVEEKIFSEKVLSVSFGLKKDHRLVAVGLETELVLFDLDFFNGGEDPSLLFKESPCEDSQLKWKVRRKEGTKFFHVCCKISVPMVTQITWHSKGNSFATFSTNRLKNKIAIHTLSECKSLFVFKKIKEEPVGIKFHPVESLLFVYLQKTIQVYDLKKRKLQQTLSPEVSFISDISIHPNGSHIAICSFDQRVSFINRTKEITPYRKFNQGSSLRCSSFSFENSLFVSGSDDGTLSLFYFNVTEDGSPLIVPLKKLQVTESFDNLGIVSCLFHPTQPWTLSGNSKGEIFIYI